MRWSRTLLRDYLPTGQEFVIRNLNALVASHHRAQVFSLVMLLISSTGIFMPLEVALNRVWGFPNNRSYFGNQTDRARTGFCLRIAGAAVGRADGGKRSSLSKARCTAMEPGMCSWSDLSR